MSQNDDKKLKGKFYKSNVIHPLVNTTNDVHLQTDGSIPKPSFAYGQHTPYQTEVVTGYIELVETSPNLQMRCRLDGREGVFYGTLPTMYPTGGVGKSIGVPITGQRFTGSLRAYSQQVHITSFFNLMSDTGEEGTQTSLKPAAAGDTKLKSGGKFSPEVGMTEEGVLSMRTGNMATMILDGKQGKKTESLVESMFTTHGNTQSIDFNKADTTGLPMTSTFLWSQGKHKDINFVTDKWEDTETPLLLPGLGPYVDKAVIRSGLIKGMSPIEDLGHLYEIRTQQSHTDGYSGSPIPMTPSLPPPIGTDKSCFTHIQLGKQKDNNQYSTSRPGGELISFRAKDFYTDGSPFSTARMASESALPQPQTHLLRFGKLTGSDNDLFTIRSQYGGGLTNIPATGEGWDIDDKFHESHSLSWGGNGGTYLRENHHSFAGSYDIPIIADITEGVKQEKTYSQSGALRHETLAYNAAGPFPETFNYTHTVNSASDWWSRTLLHSDGDMMAPTETSYTSKFGASQSTYKHLLSESAGDSSSQLTLGTDTGKMHVDTVGETATLSLATDLGEINVVNTDGSSYKLNFSGGTITIECVNPNADTQVITMDGTNILIDAGPTPVAGGIKIGGTGGEQGLVTQAWVDMIFASHVHPTAGLGPPSPPIAPPAVPAPNTPTSPITFELNAE